MSGPVFVLREEHRGFGLVSGGFGPFDRGVVQVGRGQSPVRSCVTGGTEALTFHMDLSVDLNDAMLMK